LSARERLRRRARDLACGRRASRRSPLVFEPLEGRFLLSADVLVLSDPLLASTLPALVEPLEPATTPSITVASPVNVDGLVDVALSGLVLDRATGTFDSRATITNVSADETLQGPMRLLVTSIASAGSVTLANSDGQTEEGDAFVDVPLPDGGLAPGSSIDDILLKFSDPSFARFTFTTSVEAVPETGDGEAPDISAALANDTGRDDADEITFDPTVSGTVTDAGAVAAFRAGLDGTPEGAFTDVLSSLGPGGTFILDAPALAAINGGPLAEGDHTLHLVATDDAGNTSPVLSLSFMLDTKAPVAPAFDLDPDSDTPPAGDQQTTQATVTLTGETEPGASVTLAQAGAESTADGAGIFAFGDVALALGANPFTARGTDLAGNQSEFTLTLTRPEAEEAPFTLAEHTRSTAPTVSGSECTEDRFSRPWTRPRSRAPPSPPPPARHSRHRGGGPERPLRPAVLRRAHAGRHRGARDGRRLGYSRRCRRCAARRRWRRRSRRRAHLRLHHAQHGGPAGDDALGAAGRRRSGPGPVHRRRYAARARRQARDCR
jgi:hypothetical protein